MTTTKNIRISELEVNKGQIEGLPKNPRFIRDTRYEALKKSIEDAPEMLALRELIVYPKGKKYVVIAGNMRLRACRDIGYKELPCKVLDKDTPVEKLREYTIKDNNGFGEDDWDILANEWDEVELKEWGMEIPTEWDNGDEEEEEEEEEIVEDEVPEDVETVCKRGDVWILGEHRLMCGDSTNAEDVEKLMNGKKADMVFTDPPYGMNAVSKSGVLSKRYKNDIMNDNDNKVAINSFKLIQELYGNAFQVWWGANYYTECLPNSECWIVWDKNNGESDQTDCELAYTNFRSVVRQFTMASEKINRVHPTQKPVKLFSDIIKKFDQKNEVSIVLDVFGGSGSTLIACEQLKRKCYTMELDEHYCDVIIARWEKLTGNKAKKLK